MSRWGSLEPAEEKHVNEFSQVDGFKNCDSARSVPKDSRGVLQNNQATSSRSVGLSLTCGSGLARLTEFCNVDIFIVVMRCMAISVASELQTFTCKG